MGMKRERTVVEVSDEQAQNEFKKLMREKTMAEKNMSEEQKRQEELVSCLHLCTILVTTAAIVLAFLMTEIVVTSYWLSC